MGVDKASLPFGGETMLARVVGRLSTVVDAIALVAAQEQPLPEVPATAATILIARDARPGRGPLEGLAAGLRSLPEGYGAAFVTSCDAPLLSSAFVERMFLLLDEAHDIVAPTHAGRVHPLAAVYRRGVVATVEQLLAGDQLKMQGLLAACRTRIVSAETWRDVDPESHSLLNCNTTSDYEAALRLAELLD